MYTTILAIANYRLKATDKTVLTFGERAAGQPEAIKAWFYPGQTWARNLFGLLPTAYDRAYSKCRGHRVPQNGAIREEARGNLNST
jgi:hypothetical protein